MGKKILLAIAVLGFFILAFGYWHYATHSSLYVSLKVVTEAAEETRSGLQPGVQFLDAQGRILANGVRDKQYDFLHLMHPVYGDCRDVEKAAAFSNDARSSWQECFEHLSVWIADWIGDVVRVNVEYGDCLIEDVPIALSQSRADWYLWWLPHPHIGGKPYSNYSATIAVDEKDCAENRP